MTCDIWPEEARAFQFEAIVIGLLTSSVWKSGLSIIFLYLFFILLLIIQSFFLMIQVFLQTDFLLYLDFLCKQTYVHILQLRSNAKCYWTLCLYMFSCFRVQMIRLVEHLCWCISCNTTMTAQMFMPSLPHTCVAVLWSLCCSLCSVIVQESFQT